MIGVHVRWSEGLALLHFKWDSTLLVALIFSACAYFGFLLYDALIAGHFGAGAAFVFGGMLLVILSIATLIARVPNK